MLKGLTHLAENDVVVCIDEKRSLVVFRIVPVKEKLGRLHLPSGLVGLLLSV